MDVLYRDVPVHDATELSGNNYKPDGQTPLYDAIGKTLTAMEHTSSALCVIITDGQENASKQYTQQQIAKLIQAKIDAGWTFVYLGANQDAWAASAQLGIQGGNTMSYDVGATKAMYAGLADATRYYVARGQSTGAFFADANQAPEHYHYPDLKKTNAA